MRLSTRKLLQGFVLFVLLLTTSLWGRDWVKDPPWVEVPFAPRVVAIGDSHGAFPEFSASLECLGVAKRESPDSFKLKWTGNTTLLVFTGDFNDRGLNTKEVYDAVMDLEEQAKAAGGQVIPLLGNHEVLLLNGTTEYWAKNLKPPKQQHYQNTLDSFTKAGLDFHEAISPKGKYGAWIRRRPLFAIVNDFLFIHGGLPEPQVTRSELAAQFRENLEAENWKEGGFFMMEKGPLWHRDWWDNADFVQKGLQAFGARGVVFGHTIGAMGIKGNVNVKDNQLVGIDVGMTPAYGNSKGGGLLIAIDGSGKMVFRAKYPDRPETLLFQVPAPVSKPAIKTGVRNRRR